MVAMAQDWEELLYSLLAALKVDLYISTKAMDERLIQYLKSAYQSIQEEGITLDANADLDKELVVMYARWTWNKRATGERMPRMLRYALNNRLFSQKMAVEENG